MRNVNLLARVARGEELSQPRASLVPEMES